MSKSQLKNTLIKKYEKYLLIKTLLQYRFYMHSAIRRKKVSLLKVTLYFFEQLIRIFVSDLFNFFRKYLNLLRERTFAQEFRRLLLKNCPLLKKYFFSVPLPENLLPEDTRLFKHNNFYLLKPHRLRKVRNVFLYLATDFGIIHRRLSIIRSSVHGSWDKRNISIVGAYQGMIFNSLARHFFAGEGVSSVMQEDNKYLLTHNWFNYYHWLTESYSRLFTVKNELSEYTLILPETLKNNDYVNASLDILGPVKIKYLPNESTTLFRKLHFVSIKKYCDNYDPELLDSMRSFICSEVIKMNINPPVKSERIFINRKTVNNRNILNQDDFFPLLKRYGFEIIEFEDYSFYEQVMMMQHCKYLIGAHGSGLTNMLFMKGKASVFELHRIVRDKNDHHSKVYWRMAGALKHRYLYQFCAIDPENDSFFTTNISVDIDTFEENLKLFLKDE